jgi:virginiamycin B lyase
VARFAGLALAVVGVGLGCAAVVAAGSGSVRSAGVMSVPLQIASPDQIAAGSDGNMWFVERGVGRVGRITPAGVITEFSAGLSPGFHVAGIAAGPDGNMWLTEERFPNGAPAAARIARITPSGLISESGIDVSPFAYLGGITAGPDGNMWVTGATAAVRGGIGRITPAGIVTAFFAGLGPDAKPTVITAGADGNLWFTEPANQGDSVGRITPAGVATQFNAGSDVNPSGITAGADGNTWFSLEGIDTIGRITPTGAITRYQHEPDTLGPTAMALGPDGNVWFAKAFGIGRITPSGITTQFSKGISPGPQPGARGPSTPSGIAAGPDGNLWFTEGEGRRIGRITPAGIISEFPATAHFVTVRQTSVSTIGVRLHCPATALNACRGTLHVGQTVKGGARAFRVAPGDTRDVTVVLSARMRRLVALHTQVRVTLLLRPVPHSLAGALSQRLTLRART